VAHYDLDSEIDLLWGISRIIFCPKILCLDGVVVWSTLDRYTLTLAGFLALTVYLFRRGRMKKPT
jgi:hypothetical protein